MNLLCFSRGSLLIEIAIHMITQHHRLLPLRGKLLWLSLRLGKLVGAAECLVLVSWVLGRSLLTYLLREVSQFHQSRGHHLIPIRSCSAAFQLLLHICCILVIIDVEWHRRSCSILLLLRVVYIAAILNRIAIVRTAEKVGLMTVLLAGAAQQLVRIEGRPLLGRLFLL